MATSGNFLTSDAGRGGNPYFTRMIFEWWETGRGISGSVGYHNINYHLKTYGGSSGYWQASNGSMNVDGAGYSWGRGNWYGGGATVLGDYSKTLYTDGNGNRSFGASAQVAIYTTSINSSGSGSWGLDNIPLHAILTGISTDAGGIPFTDEGPAWVEFADPSGTHVWAFIDAGTSGRITTQDTYSTHHDFAWSPTTTQLIQQGSVNSNQYSINIGVQDNLTGGTYYDYRTKTGYIANDHGQANPLFTNFTITDTNAATLALTGNGQYIIEGESQIGVTVPVANKATPQKYANMDHYTVNMGYFSNDIPYSSSSDVTISAGYVYYPPTQIAQVQEPITVTAVDSRGNTASVTKNATAIPYRPPYVNATATRVNGYDDALILAVAGNVHPVVVGGVEKNRINATSGTQYRFTAADSGVDITTLGWTNLGNTQATDGTVAGTSTVILAASGVPSATHAYWVQVRIVDGLYTTTQTIYVPTGTPIFRIGLDKILYNNESPIVSQANMGLIAGFNLQKHNWIEYTGSTSFYVYDGTADGTDIPTTTTSQYRYLRYMKDATGVVHLQGLLKNTTGSTRGPGIIVASMPAGFRPGHRVLFPTLVNDVLGRIDIDVDGTISISGSNGVPAGGYLSFNGISYVAEQ